MRKQTDKMVLLFGIVLLFLTLFVLASPLSFAEGNGSGLTVVYFYENACDSCNPEGEFVELFNRLVGDVKKDVDVELLMYNTFHDSGFRLMQKYFEDDKVPEEKQMAPILFLGDKYLAGSKEIEERLRDEFIDAKATIAAETVAAEATTTKTTAAEAKDAATTAVGEPAKEPSLLYFYVTGCSSCGEVDQFLDALDINTNRLNIAEPKNLDLIKRYFQAYGVPEKDQSAPIVFIGDRYLSGEDAIKERLVEEIRNGKGFESLLPIREESSGNGLSGYGILGVLATGFLNGLNPCSVSMLLFFFSMIMARNVNILKMSFSYISGKFVTYFLLGTLLFRLFAGLDIPWFQTAVRVILAVLAFFVAVLYISDYSAARKEQYERIRMQLPVFLRKRNHQWIRKFTSAENVKVLLPVSFALGALISVGEFLCTGQIYLATILSVLHNSQVLDIQAILYFILYGLAFVSPLSLLTVLIYRGREIFDASEWAREKMPMIKLINAIFFIAFGVIVLIWF